MYFMGGFADFPGPRRVNCFQVWWWTHIVIIVIAMEPNHKYCMDILRWQECVCVEQESETFHKLKLTLAIMGCHLCQNYVVVFFPVLYIYRTLFIIPFQIQICNQQWVYKSALFFIYYYRFINTNFGFINTNSRFINTTFKNKAVDLYTWILYL